MTIRARRVTVEQISRSILVVRNHRVLLDQDLASLYGVTTGVLVQAVRRNPGRFPADFLFQLTVEEWNISRSQIVISRSGHGARQAMTSRSGFTLDCERLRSQFATLKTRLSRAQ